MITRHNGQDTERKKFRELFDKEYNKKGLPNNQELLKNIINESYRKKYKDEQTIDLYKTSINAMKHRTDISQSKVDGLLVFLQGRFKKVIDLIDLYLSGK